MKGNDMHVIRSDQFFKGYCPQAVDKKAAEDEARIWLRIGDIAETILAAIKTKESAK